MRITLTLRVDRELAVAVAVSEHARGVELPQGAFPALLRRAREDLVVVGEAQQAHHLGERQIDGRDRSPRQVRHHARFRNQRRSGRRRLSLRVGCDRDSAIRLARFVALHTYAHTRARACTRVRARAHTHKPPNGIRTVFPHSRDR